MVHGAEHLDGSTIEGSLGYHLDASGLYYTICWYGLNTETANKTTHLRLTNTGVINFSSDMADEEIILEYVSMEWSGTDSDVKLNKLFEDYIYAYIKALYLIQK